MKFLVVIKVPLVKPFAFWKERFEANRSTRQAAGIEDVFACAVVGEQAVLYAVKTLNPRLVHDFIYQDELRPEIEASGFVVGREVLTICELVD